MNFDDHQGGTLVAGHMQIEELIREVKAEVLKPFSEKLERAELARVNPRIYKLMQEKYFGQLLMSSYFEEEQ